MGRPLVIDTGSEQLILQPTTLDQVGKSEAYFETIIADAYRRNIDLLGLGSQRRAIRGPFHVVTQLPMQTPFGHNIYPDIALLSASGHVIVIEVKRYVNQELRNREVIAQIVDYASSFAVLKEAQLLPLFRGEATAQSWLELVETAFPQVDDAFQLAADFANCMAEGRINLVIACDKIPSVLLDAVAGISSLNATAFELEVIEVTPYTRLGSQDLLFLPATRLSTQIVNRSVVTINYRTGDEKPVPQVTMTSVEEIEAEIKKIRSTSPDAQEWDLEKIEEECRKHGAGRTLPLLAFALQESAGPVFEPGEKVNPGFNFRMQSPTTGVRRIIFSCNPWDSQKPLYFYLKNVRRVTSDESLIQQLLVRLNDLGLSMKNDFGEGYLYGINTANKIQQFIDIVRWLKQQVATLPTFSQ